MKRLSPAAPTAAMSGGIALLAFLTVLLVTSLVRSNGGVAAAVARGSDPSAPTFALEPLNQSQKVDLDVYAGRVVVINFWASWCGPCRAEAPTFETLRSEILRIAAPGFIGEGP